MEKYFSEDDDDNDSLNAYFEECAAFDDADDTNFRPSELAEDVPTNTLASPVIRTAHTNNTLRSREELKHQREVCNRLADYTRRYQTIFPASSRISPPRSRPKASLKSMVQSCSTSDEHSADQYLAQLLLNLMSDLLSLLADWPSPLRPQTGSLSDIVALERFSERCQELPGVESSFAYTMLEGAKQLHAVDSACATLAKRAQSLSEQGQTWNDPTLEVESESFYLFIDVMNRVADGFKRWAVGKIEQLAQKFPPVAEVMPQSGRKGELRRKENAEKRIVRQAALPSYKDVFSEFISIVGDFNDCGILQTVVRIRSIAAKAEHSTTNFAVSDNWSSIIDLFVMDSTPASFDLSATRAQLQFDLACVSCMAVPYVHAAVTYLFSPSNENSTQKRRPLRLPRALRRAQSSLDAAQGILCSSSPEVMFKKRLELCAFIFTHGAAPLSTVARSSIAIAQLITPQVLNPLKGKEEAEGDNQSSCFPFPLNSFQVWVCLDPVGLGWRLGTDDQCGGTPSRPYKTEAKVSIQAQSSSRPWSHRRTCRLEDQLSSGIENRTLRNDAVVGFCASKLSLRTWLGKAVTDPLVCALQQIQAEVLSKIVHAPAPILEMLQQHELDKAIGGKKPFWWEPPNEKIATAASSRDSKASSRGQSPRPLSRAGSSTALLGKSPSKLLEFHQYSPFSCFLQSIENIALFGAWDRLGTFFVSPLADYAAGGSAGHLPPAHRWWLAPRSTGSTEAQYVAGLFREAVRYDGVDSELGSALMTVLYNVDGDDVPAIRDHVTAFLQIVPPQKNQMVTEGDITKWMAFAVQCAQLGIEVPGACQTLLHQTGSRNDGRVETRFSGPFRTLLFLCLAQRRLQQKWKAASTAVRLTVGGGHSRHTSISMAAGKGHTLSGNNDAYTPLLVIRALLHPIDSLLRYIRHEIGLEVAAFRNAITHITAVSHLAKAYESFLLTVATLTFQTKETETVMLHIMRLFRMAMELESNPMESSFDALSPAVRVGNCKSVVEGLVTQLTMLPAWQNRQRPLVSMLTFNKFYSIE